MLANALREADAANRAKSEFLASISHELRTPLNGVLGMADVIAMGELAPVQRERLEVVRRSGEALLSIVNDVLDIAHIEAGSIDIETRAFDAADLAKRVEATHRAAARAKPQIRFSVAAAAEVAGARRGDADRIGQVIDILVANALKFTDQGEVKVSMAGLGPHGDDGLVVTVVDTGVGIPLEVIPKLFQKFTQADGSNTRRFGGAGLGLAIARALTELMGGRIVVESVPGEGSTFTVTLPAARQVAAASRAAA